MRTWNSLPEGVKLGFWVMMCLLAVTFLYCLIEHDKKERRATEARFQSYLRDQHCTRTGFVPDGKEVASIYTCDNGVWLSYEIWQRARHPE